MKSIKSKAGFLVLAVSTLLLAACGGGNGGASSQGAASSAKASSSKEAASSAEVVVKKVKVTINGEASEVALGSALTEPAAPAAPAGKKFYGWKNTKNGGQIWNFKDEVLNQVMEEVVLEPFFVAATGEQILEAELCPEIPTMKGATYSGGQFGKGLIGRDWDGNYGATSVNKITYLRDDADETYEVGDAEGIKAGATQVSEDIEYGAFVHFNYCDGNKLSFKVNSPAAQSGVTLMARYSAEYGLTDPETDEIKYSFTDEMFQVKVNGTAQKYGNVTLHNIIDKDFIYFQDYVVGDVDLKAGENTIELLVSNKVSLNGTIEATSPIVDSIKLFGGQQVTWTEAKQSNLAR